MNKIPGYKEGDWFAVPLRSGGYSIGKIARMKKGKILFGYFFGPRYKSLPQLEQVENLSFKNAAAAYRFGDLGLYKNEWPIIGSPVHWAREKWPMPAFYRKDPLMEDHHRRVVHSDDDPAKEILEESVPFEMVKDLPGDGLMGYVAVENVLDELLK